MNYLYYKHQQSFDALNIPAFSHICDIFEQYPISDITHEQFLFQQFQFLDYQTYKEARLNYLRDNSSEQYLIDYLTHYQPKVGLYAGSFHPFHQGHLNILQKAEKIFDKVIIAQGINPTKSSLSTSPEEIFQQRPSCLCSREFVVFKGFLTDLISQQELNQNITLIRGLRNGNDLDYEVNQLRFMQDMKPNIQVVFIPCDKQYEHISSSSLRNLEHIQPNSSSTYLPE